jgi:hypothetical protein
MTVKPPACRRRTRWTARAIRLRDDRNAPLLLRFLRSARSSWQLQHDGVLTFAQPGHEHDLPVGELKRIVMHVGLAFVDLLEASHLLAELRAWQ